jgi:methionyl-tRNA synthetase
MSDMITINDFNKLDIRIAKIVAAEQIPKSKKLIKITVDLGNEIRTLVAGIAETYVPDSLIGKLVPVLTNLQPVTLMGVQSNGMILAADAEGKPIILAVDAPVPPGTKIR